MELEVRHTRLSGLVQFRVLHQGMERGRATLSLFTHEIIDLWLEVDERQLGIGTLLMMRIAEEAKRAGLPRVFVTVVDDNFASRQLFEQLGWKRLTKYELEFTQGGYRPPPPPGPLPPPPMPIQSSSFP